MSDRWLSVDEIADHLGVSRDTVYAWLSKKQMPGHRAGHLWRFKCAEVDAWLRAGGASNADEGGTGSRGSEPVDMKTDSLVVAEGETDAT